MSEPNQFFLQVQISRAQRDAFLQSVSAPASQFPDLLAWIAGESYYGEPLTPEALDLACAGASPQQWLDGWTQPRQAASALNTYDEASQTWTVALLEFDENYTQFVVALAIFSGLAAFKDIDSTDFLLIYGFLYDGGDVTAAMAITRGSARIAPSSPPAEWVSRADETLNAMLQRLSDAPDSQF